MQPDIKELDGSYWYYNSLNLRRLQILLVALIVLPTTINLAYKLFLYFFQLSGWPKPEHSGTLTSTLRAAYTIIEATTHRRLLHNIPNRCRRRAKSHNNPSQSPHWPTADQPTLVRIGIQLDGNGTVIKLQMKYLVYIHFWRKRKAKYFMLLEFFLTYVKIRNS